MDEGNANPSAEPRIPTIEDLVSLCRHLNEVGARYIVIGGWAIIQLGFGRTTGDIDLLVDSSPENFQKIKKAMLFLPDAAIREVQPGDLDKYVVVRVGDEITVDLMKAACGVEFAEASASIAPLNVQGVDIPFASASLMLRLKQTYREKDAFDREYLRQMLDRQGARPKK